MQAAICDTSFMDHISTGEPFLLGMAALGAAKLSVLVLAPLGAGSWGQRSWRHTLSTNSFGLGVILQTDLNCNSRFRSNKLHMPKMYYQKGTSLNINDANA